MPFRMTARHSTFALAVLTLLFTITCAQWLPQVSSDTRTLDQIYAAAQEETGPLQVFFGGDGREPCSIIKTRDLLLIFSIP